MIFSYAQELFLENLKTLEKSPETISGYKFHLDRLSIYLIKQYNRPVHIEEVTPDDIERYLFNELNESKYSASHRHNLITAFKSLYGYCYRKGYCKKDIRKLIRNIYPETKERITINEMEYRKIVREIDHPTVKAVIQTLYYTGLRISECISLTLNDVDFENEVIKVLKGKGNKQRIVPMNKNLIPILRDYLEKDRIEKGTGKLFSSESGSICVQYVRRILSQAVKDAGIKKHVSPHILRHTFASNLIQRGANLLSVQKLLGHESIKTTGIYLHTTVEELADAVEVL